MIAVPMATASQLLLLEDKSAPVALPMVAAPTTPTTPTPTAAFSPTTPATPPIMPVSWRVRTPTVPEPGSLYDLLCQNPGTALFVRPILWTEQHTRLLRASFETRAPIMAPMPDGRSTSANHLRPSRVAEALSRDVTMLLSEDAAGLDDGPRPDVSGRISRVLATLYPTSFSCCALRQEFRLYFGMQGYRCYVRAPAVWTMGRGDGGSDSGSDSGSGSGSGSGSDSGPVVAYVNRGQLAMLRQLMFSGDRRLRQQRDGGQMNMPVRRLLSLKLKEVLPRDADCDAYLVGMFVAMAQAHFYDDGGDRNDDDGRGSGSGGGLRGPLYCRAAAVAAFRDVELRILTHDNTTAEFMVYTAVVTASFLQRFLTPTKAASAGATDGLQIAHVRVPAFPIVGLKERLGQALGHDLVGDDLPPAGGDGSGADADDGDMYRGMETWETAEDRQTRLGGTKRKRGAETEQPGDTEVRAGAAWDNTCRKKRRTRSSAQVC